MPASEWSAQNKRLGPFRSDMERVIAEIAATLREEFGRELTDRELQIAIESYPWHEQFREPLHAAWRDNAIEIMTDAGNAQWAEFGFRGSFTIQNPYSQAWLVSHGAEMVQGVTAQTRDAIRDIVRESFREGLDVSQRANLIGEVVGLNQRQSIALARQRAEMVAEGIPEARISSLMAKRARRMHRRRADLIARTEGVQAHAQGTIDSWKDAERQGQLGGGAKKRWIAGGGKRTCEICSDLWGQEVPLDAKFYSTVTSREYDRPPSHPACRCALGLLPR